MPEKSALEKLEEVVQELGMTQTLETLACVARSIPEGTFGKVCDDDIRWWGIVSDKLQATAQSIRTLI